MDSTRQQKIAKLIQKELAEIFLADGIPVYDCMITVTKTSVTKDLSLARSYISIFNAEDNEKVLKAVKSNIKEIRYRLGQKVKNQLRTRTICSSSTAALRSQMRKCSASIWSSRISPMSSAMPTSCAASC